MGKQDKASVVEDVTDDRLYRAKEVEATQAPLRCRVGFGARTVIPGVEGTVGFMNGLWYPALGWAEVEHAFGKTIVTPQVALITILKDQDAS